MKKVLAILVATALVGAYVFADDAAPVAKINGKVETGFLINTVKLGSDNNLTLADKDDSGKCARIELGGSISAPDYGVVVNFRDDYALDSTGADNGLISGLTFQAAYAWANAFNKMLVTKAGILSETSTATAGDDGFLKFDTRQGISFNVNPIAGLAINWMIPLSATGRDTMNVLANSTVAAKYTMDKVFYAAVGIENTTAVVNKANTDVAFGVGLLAVENLTLNAEGKFFLDKVTNRHEINETVAYTMDKLTLKLVSYQYLKNGDMVSSASKAGDLMDDKTSMKFNPSVSYDLGAVKPTVGFTYNTAKCFVDDKAGSWDLNANVAIPAGAGKIVVGGDILTNNGSAKSTDVGGKLYTSYEFTF